MKACNRPLKTQKSSRSAIIPAQGGQFRPTGIYPYGKGYTDPGNRENAGPPLHKHAKNGLFIVSVR
ncbi:MAG: hypothetical protein CVU89_04830 [Firmicutes bacterium HGW-Firmicutes-14]|nr:MAG: hypothetical protein CVU89_04830 [Firmicutes bacterium HGW-Firmicutes-14]